MLLSLGQIVAVLQGFSSKLSAGSEKPHRRVIAPLCHCGENCSGCSKHTTALNMSSYYGISAFASPTPGLGKGEVGMGSGKQIPTQIGSRLQNG